MQCPACAHPQGFCTVVPLVRTQPSVWLLLWCSCARVCAPFSGFWCACHMHVHSHSHVVLADMCLGLEGRHFVQHTLMLGRVCCARCCMPLVSRINVGGVSAVNTQQHPSSMSSLLFSSVVCTCTVVLSFNACKSHFSAQHSISICISEGRSRVIRR